MSSLDSLCVSSVFPSVFHMYSPMYFICIPPCISSEFPLYFICIPQCISSVFPHVYTESSTVSPVFIFLPVPFHFVSYNLKLVIFQYFIPATLPPLLSCVSHFTHILVHMVQNLVISISERRKVDDQDLFTTFRTSRHAFLEDSLSSSWLA